MRDITRRLLWLATIWAMGVAVLGLVAGLLRLALKAAAS